ncbi:MAG: YqeG family HAD IIIA-type phosphatase, partial [Clostridia bacterium]|nr:YqeG family HAD IIIA-type phosphatase [Clostridia bacterium]
MKSNRKVNSDCFLYLKGKGMGVFKSFGIFKRITDIDIDYLKENNIDTLLLDVDNTLSTHHGTVLVDGLREWLDKMVENGISLVVVSNSKKWRIEPFAKRLELPFVSLACKPLPFGYSKAQKMMNSQKSKTAIVGDQIFTDVLGANLFGIKSLLVRP